MVLGGGQGDPDIRQSAACKVAKSTLRMSPMSLPQCTSWLLPYNFFKIGSTAGLRSSAQNLYASGPATVVLSARLRLSRIIPLYLASSLLSASSMQHLPGRPLHIRNFVGETPLTSSQVAWVFLCNFSWGRKRVRDINTRFFASRRNSAGWHEVVWRPGWRLGTFFCVR